MKPLPVLFAVFSAIGLAVFVPTRLFSAQPPATLVFNRDIRPILADACYHCHGPDKARRKANLRLDVEADAKAVRDGRAAIVPKNLEKSELIRRITSHDPTERMPPANSGRSLSPEQIERLRRWVEQGAAWQQHWAFIPPVRPELPKVKNEAWVRNPIDRFILARLEREGLSPSPEAAKTTLIRRLSFDLTGLPPTPEEVDDFLRDSAANPLKAYEKLVDRLLASPRYGERMAWRWLEAARYADTNGYQTDAERDMRRRRDWVIEAYNRNLPFDQFTIEQIAGDMLPRPTLDQKIATGFNRNHRGNAEGGIVPEEYAVEYVVDRVETTATVWLGLTLGCARCHEHKFDPFSQKEFYQLFAYFNNVPEKGRAVKFGNSPPYIKVPTKEQEKRLEELKREEEWIAGQLLHYGWAGAFGVWRMNKKEPPQYDWVNEEKQILFCSFDREHRDNRSLIFREGAATHKKGKIGKAADFDGARFIDAGDAGHFGFQDKFSFSFWVYPRQATGAILSRMPEEAEADGYAVRLVRGKIQVHLTKRWLDDALRVESQATLGVNHWHHVVVSYDGSRAAAGVKIYVNGKPVKTTILLDELNQDFKNSEPLRIGSGGGKESRFDGLIDEVRVYARVVTQDEAEILAVPETVGELMRVPLTDLTSGQSNKLLECFYVQHAPVEARKKRKEMFRLQEEIATFQESLPTVMVMEEMSRPRDTFVLIRGEYDKHGEKVRPGVPASLLPLPNGAPNNRLGLARWLVDPANPLTPRVAVNRLWQLHFGTGLVKTAEDFGTQGEYPTHPELLDWLATEFVGSGWDVKKMHKTIVMSATYRQASRLTKEMAARDPDNRLLARGPRYRLSAEMVRDQALLASGLLVEKLGGPSVKPYQPAGLWKELSGGDDYQQDKGANLYRRSLYTFWKRTSAPPSLMTFDAAARETCWVRETRTNTPLQALTLLNDVTYVEAARMLAQRVLREEKTTEKRITRAFRLVVSRAPTLTEARILQQAYERNLADYRKEPAAAKKLLRIGDAKADPKLDVVELAACTAICNLILNLDETVTKE